jgi:hypothetical protein
MRKMELGHVLSEECMDVGDLSVFENQPSAFWGQTSLGFKCARLCTISGSVDLDFDFVSIGIAYPDGEALAFGAAVHFGLSGIKALTFERGNHIVNA